MMNPYEILDKIVERYKKILNKALVGIYLHGSLAMGCYTNNSDIDLLIVVKNPLDFTKKRELISAIIHMHNLPKKGIEMSIILEKYAKEFIYPTPFELHFSPSLKDKYLSDDKYICGGSKDRDLAAHMMITVHRGICLYGNAINEMFCEIPKEDYIDALIYDIENAKKLILEDTIYTILNLCRVLFYINEDAICSKLEGGNWGLKSLPLKYHKIIGEAISVYTENTAQMKHIDTDLLIEFAAYMLDEIYNINANIE